MQMPGVSGREVARQVQAMHGPQPLLLAMSATQVGEEELHGFDGFLLKPLALDDLRRALTLNKRKPRAGGRQRSRRGVQPPQGDTGGQTSIPSIKGCSASSRAQCRRRRSRSSMKYASRIRGAARPSSRDQVLAGDLTGVPRGGHQIKGAASMVGFARVARLALSLELGSCKEEDTLRLLDDLLSSCDELERILLAGKLEKAP